MKLKFLKESHRRRLTESADSYFQAYITNLGAYNDGELRGEWVTFPIDEDEFDAILEKIGCTEPGYEEWFVTDYDCDCDAYHSLGEYPSFEQLNEFAEMIEDDAFKALLEAEYFDSAKDIYESGRYEFYPDINDSTEYAYYVVDEVGGIEYLNKDTIEQHFDYEKLGRELSSEKYEDDSGEEVTAKEFWCGDEGASDEDLGYAYVDGVGFEGVANPENYFNYKSYGRDISYDGTFTKYGLIFY